MRIEIILFMSYESIKLLVGSFLWDFGIPELGHITSEVLDKLLAVLRDVSDLALTEHVHALELPVVGVVVLVVGSGQIEIRPSSIQIGQCLQSRPKSSLSACLLKYQRDNTESARVPPRYTNDFLYDLRLAANFFMSLDWYLEYSERVMVRGSSLAGAATAFSAATVGLAASLDMYQLNITIKQANNPDLTDIKQPRLILLTQDQVTEVDLGLQSGRCGFVKFGFLLFCQLLPFLLIILSSMYFDSDESLARNEGPARTVFIYENSCNNKQPIEFRIRSQTNIFRDIAQLLKFRKLRLFNEEGAEYFEDDLRFVKNKTSLYASKGEEFDPHNCFGQYEMVRKLGEGGFGKVFLANHKHSKEKCAIKIINITSASDVDSIFVEAEILKSLKHENIVKVTNCLTLKNMEVAIIMEYLQGGELLKYVQKQGRLDQETCKTFLRQIVKGIMYCHENNLIHRDLKLENIVLVNSEEKKIKIIDFGIAGVMSRLTEEDLDAGSLGYMSPECFQPILTNANNEPNFKFDGRMDVWAIGVILYSMLCAELPFKGSTTHEIKENIKKSQYKIPSDIKKAISKQCLSVIFRCLDPNPKTRIKIGELMIHEWFTKSELSNEKTLMTNVVEVEEMAISTVNDVEIIKDEKVDRTDRPVARNLAPIREIQEHNRTSSSFMKKLVSAKKNVANRSQNPSVYKNKEGGKIRLKSPGKENHPQKQK